MVKSYIKVYGPPLAEAFRKLEQVAVEMPEVSFFTTTMVYSPDVAFDPMSRDAYIAGMTAEVPIERKSKLISKSGTTLGEYDFFFEWPMQPKWNQVEALIKRIDKALKPLGCLYTITTK